MEPKKKSIKNQVGWIGLGNLINALVNVLLVPYLARALSVELYGSYGQVLMLLGIANVVFAFGLSKIVYQELNNQEDSLTGSMSVLYTSILLGAVGSVLFLLFADQLASFFDNQKLAPLIRIYGFSLLFTLASELLRSVLTHFYKSDKIAIAAILHNTFRVSIIFISINYLNSLRDLFFGLLILEVVNMIYLLLNLPDRKVFIKVSSPKIIENLKKGVPLALTGTASILLVQTDGVMISRMLGTEEYAIFRMGAIPIPFLFIIYASVTRVTSAEVNKLFFEKKNSELILLKRKASSAISYLTYPLLIFFIVFAEPFFFYYLGEKYLASISVFMIYNLLLFIRINDYRDVLIAASKNKEIFYIHLAMLIMNCVLNYLLIRAYGVNGAVVASISSYYILHAIMQYRMSKLLQVSFFAIFNIKKLWRIVLLCISIAIAVRAGYNFYPSILSLAISCLLYVGLTYWLLLITKVLDRQLILDYTEKISVLKPLHSILLKINV